MFALFCFSSGQSICPWHCSFNHCLSKDSTREAEPVGDIYSTYIIYTQVSYMLYLCVYIYIYMRYHTYIYVSYDIFIYLSLSTYPSIYQGIGLYSFGSQVWAC